VSPKSEEPTIADGNNDSDNKQHYHKMEQARRTYMRKNLALALDNPKTINDMENEPAYKRRNVVLDDTKELKARADLSRFEISPDGNNPLQQSNNSFLHENVD